jgi:hypothetical protein
MEKALKTLRLLHVTRFIGLQGKLSHAASLFEALCIQPHGYYADV